MNTTLLLSLGAGIKTDATAIKHIDIYNQQYEERMDGKVISFNKPAVFIEFLDTQWDLTVNNVQEGEGRVRIHTVLETYKGTYKIMDKDDAEQAAMLAHYAIPKQVNRAIQGKEFTGALSVMERVNTIYDHDYDNIIVEINEYAFRDYDDSANADAELVTARLEDVQANNQIIREITED